MNPSDWIYHLSLRTLVHENGLLDPGAQAGARPGRARRPRDARRAAATRVAVLVPLLLLAAAILHG